MKLCKSLMWNSINFLYRKDELEDLYASLRYKTDINDDVLEQIKRARFKVAITGAGISRASGLPLLNDSVAGMPLREFFNGTLFRENPEQFYSLYRQILKRFLAAQPNPAHMALAQSDTWIITQNIDGLHRDAGSSHVLEIHGNIRELYCTQCGLVESSERAFSYTVPRCPDCGSVLHPGIVLQGEEVRHVSRAMDWAGRAQVVFIVGTKLTAEPAARLPEVARENVPVFEINQDAEVLLPIILLQEHF